MGVTARIGSPLAQRDPTSIFDCRLTCLQKALCNAEDLASLIRIIIYLRLKLSPSVKAKSAQFFTQ